MPTIILTPNISLQIPSYNLANWQTPMGYDLQLLDLLLSGQKQLTDLALSGGIAFGTLGDTGISRSASGGIALGNGTPGDESADVYAAFFHGDGSHLTNLAPAGSGIALEVNGAANGSQSALNLAAGANVTLADNGSGTVTIASSGGGGSGAPSLWAGLANPNGTSTDFAPHTMTGDAAPSPYTVTESSSYISASGFRLFDGAANGTSSWFGAVLPCWVCLDLGSGVTKSLSSYAIRLGVYDPYISSPRQPTAWTLSGSNDGTTWTTLDTQTHTGSPLWSGTDLTLPFLLASASAPYRYFRLDITGNNGDPAYTCVSELYLYATTVSPFASGAAGDFFLDYAGKAFYGPKSGTSTWPLVGALT